MEQFWQHPKEIRVNKFLQQLIAVFLSITLIFASISNTFAQSIVTNNACKDTGVIFAFMNGVFTTEKEAKENKRYLERIYGTKLPNGENNAL
jgi:hypothetical protein